MTNHSMIDIGARMKQVIHDVQTQVIDDEFDKIDALVRNYAFYDDSPNGLKDAEETARLYMNARAGDNRVDVESALYLAEINFAAVSRALSVAKQSSVASSRSFTLKARQDFIDAILMPALRCRLRLKDRAIYLCQSWGYWTRVASSAEFITLCQIMARMLPDLELTQQSRFDAFVKSLTQYLTYSAGQDSALIQFNDCVLLDGVVSQSSPGAFPRYFFDRRVWAAASTLTPTKPVAAVDDLLKHLSSNDDDVKDCLIDRIAMSLLPSNELKSELGPVIVILYGPSAENGKSTFAKLLQRAFGHQNVSTFSFSGFKGYELVKLRDNLLLVDMEASGVYVDSEVSTTLKSAVTSDTVSTRDIYKAPEDTVPFAQFLVCTNSAPKADDKTRGWDRRLEWYEISEKLVRDDEWWNELNSEDAATYMFELLLIHAIKLAKAHRRVVPPKRITDANDRYVEMNNNVTQWIESLEVDGKRGRDALIRMPAGMAFDLYAHWCGDNAETKLGHTNFNRVISTELGLEKRGVTIYNNTEPSAMRWWRREDTDSPDPFRQADDRAFVKCWVEKR